MRYEALGPGIDGSPSKTSSALVNFISHSLCVGQMGLGFMVGCLISYQPLAVYEVLEGLGAYS